MSVSNNQHIFSLSYTLKLCQLDQSPPYPLHPLQCENIFTVDCWFWENLFVCMTMMSYPLMLDRLQFYWMGCCRKWKTKFEVLTNSKVSWISNDNIEGDEAKQKLWYPNFGSPIHLKLPYCVQLSAHLILKVGKLCPAGDLKQVCSVLGFIFYWRTSDGIVGSNGNVH